MAEKQNTDTDSAFSLPLCLQPETLGVSAESLKQITKTFSELKLMTRPTDLKPDDCSKNVRSCDSKTTDVPTEEKTKSQHKKQTLNCLSKNDDTVASKDKKKQYINVLLLGKTGNGKSATGNSILGRHYFKSQGLCTSVTTEVTYEVVEFGKRKHVIKVFDGPGIGDTTHIDDVEKATELAINKMEDAVLLNPDGYHAFLLLIKYGNRLTAEDKECIRILKAIFGPDFVKNYCILIVTNGDSFKEDIKKSGEKCKTFKDWCLEQEGIFHELLCECDYRVVLFDNTSFDKKVRKPQIKNLIELVDKIQYGSRTYTKEQFQHATRNRQMLIAEVKEPRIREKAMHAISIIIQKLNNVTDVELTDQEEKLIQIRNEADDVYRFVLDQAKDTDMLKDLLTSIEDICKMINIRIVDVKQKVEITEKENEIKERFRDEINKKEAEYIARILEDEKRKAELIEIEEKLRLKKVNFEEEFQRREMELKAELEEEKRKALEEMQLKEMKLQEILSSQSTDEESLEQTKQTREQLDAELASIYQSLADKENALMETIEKERFEAAQLISDELQQHEIKLQQQENEMESLKKKHEEEKEKIAFFFAFMIHQLTEEVKEVICRHKYLYLKDVKEINDKYEALKKEHNEFLKQAGKKPKFTDDDDKTTEKGCMQQ